jgi:hypothetical protein
VLRGWNPEHEGSGGKEDRRSLRGPRRASATFARTTTGCVHHGQCNFYRFGSTEVQDDGVSPAVHQGSATVIVVIAFSTVARFHTVPRLPLLQSPRGTTRNYD